MPFGAILSTAANLFSANRSHQQARRNFQDNAALQREFAQHGVRWRVADAKKAGIHPVYALGGSSASFTPVASTNNSAEYFSRAGSDLSRAVAAKQTVNERLNNELLRSQVRGNEIDNEIRLTELQSMRSRLTQNQVGPPLPMTSQHSGNTIPEEQTLMTKHGPVPVVSDQYGQIIENYPPEMIRYFARENIYRAQDAYRKTKRYFKKKAYKYADKFLDWYQ